MKIINKVKKLVFNIAEKTINHFKKVATAISVVAAFSVASPVYASDTASVTGLDNYFGDVLDVIFTIFRYVGIALAIFAGGKLLLAYKDDQTEHVQKYIIFLIVAICLIFLKNLMSFITNLA